MNKVPVTSLGSDLCGGAKVNRREPGAQLSTAAVAVLFAVPSVRRTVQTRNETSALTREHPVHSAYLENVSLMHWEHLGAVIHT